MTTTQPATRPAPWLWLWLPLGLTFGALMLVDRPLHVAAAPHGIVSFELCALASSCSAILQQWAAPAREMAMFSLGLDYLFIPLYAAALVRLLLAVQRRRGTPGGTANGLPIAAVLVAACCDGVENVLLLRLLQTGSVADWALPASGAAVVKFVLLALALVVLALRFIRSGRPATTA